MCEDGGQNPSPSITCCTKVKEFSEPYTVLELTKQSTCLLSLVGPTGGHFFIGRAMCGERFQWICRPVRSVAQEGLQWPHILSYWSSFFLQLANFLWSTTGDLSQNHRWVGGNQARLRQFGCDQFSSITTQHIIANFNPFAAGVERDQRKPKIHDTKKIKDLYPVARQTVPARPQATSSKAAPLKNFAIFKAGQQHLVRLYSVSTVFGLRVIKQDAPF